MPVPTYDLPIADGSTATEEPKIITALSQIKNILDHGLDGDNISPAANILLSQIEHGDIAGQIPIVNTGGSLQYRSISGDLHISQAGAANIQPGVVTNQDLAGSIAGDKLLPGAALLNIGAGNLTDTYLASPVAPAYRLVAQSSGVLAGGAPAQTYLLGSQRVLGNPLSDQTQPILDMAYSGGLSVAEALLTPPTIFRLDLDDHDVAGKTTSFLLRTEITTNGAPSGRNFTFHIYNFTVAGAAGQIHWDVGSSTGASLTMSSPSANQVERSFVVNDDFSTGTYLFAVDVSGAIPANTLLTIHVQLYVNNI